MEGRHEHDPLEGVKADRLRSKHEIDVTASLIADVFNTEKGKKVLEHLREQCYCAPTSLLWDGNPNIPQHVICYRAGRQWVPGYIEFMIARHTGEIENGI